MAEPAVLVVLSNWQRTANTRRIAEAFARQSYDGKVTLAVVDCGPEPAGQAHFDAVWRVPNQGTVSRFLPALLDDAHDYVYFHDDDMLPGPLTVAHFVQTAELLGSKLGVLGQQGRRFKPQLDDWLYERVPIKPQIKFVPVDMCVRCHFTRPAFVRHALALRQDLLDRQPSPLIKRLVRKHDDIMLHLGIQRATGLMSFIAPTDPATEAYGGMDAAILELDQAYDAGKCISADPLHISERTALINLAITVGWRRVWYTGA